jgi:CrcB protein
MKVFLIGLAGAVGALSRYGVGVAVGTRSFPWSTLAINLVGSYLLGLVLTAGLERDWAETTTAPLAIGFLGAFTTFSTFSYEAYAMVRDDRAGTAAIYAIVSVAVGVAAAALGYLTVRTAT